MTTIRTENKDRSAIDKFLEVHLKNYTLREQGPEIAIDIFDVISQDKARFLAEGIQFFNETFATVERGV